MHKAKTMSSVWRPPNNTTHEHLQKLYDLGFRRVSFGVQDYSQSSKAIHREQPLSQCSHYFWAREIEFYFDRTRYYFWFTVSKEEDVIDTIEKQNHCNRIG
jgi:oxygen-independent coproporphyrinogen-3 oxidase